MVAEMVRRAGCRWWLPRPVTKATHMHNGDGVVLFWEWGLNICFVFAGLDCLSSPPLARHAYALFRIIFTHDQRRNLNLTLHHMDTILFLVHT